MSVVENLPFFIHVTTPGLVGALASGLFVSKSTWTSRGVGFLVGEGVAVGALYLFVCQISGANGRSLGACLADIPITLSQLAFGTLK